jgi:hypothetical protein
MKDTAITNKWDLMTVTERVREVNNNPSILPHLDSYRLDKLAEAIDFEIAGAMDLFNQAAIANAGASLSLESFGNYQSANNARTVLEFHLRSHGKIKTHAKKGGTQKGKSKLKEIREELQKAGLKVSDYSSAENLSTALLDKRKFKVDPKTLRNYWDELKNEKGK